MNPDDSFIRIEAALPREADQPGHALAGVDGIESQCLRAGGETDGFFRRRVGDAVGPGAERGCDFDSVIVPAVLEAEKGGGFAADAANVGGDALGLGVDVDADDTRRVIQGEQTSKESGLCPGAAAGVHDVGGIGVRADDLLRGEHVAHGAVCIGRPVGDEVGAASLCFQVVHDLTQAAVAVLVPRDVVDDRTVEAIERMLPDVS